MLRIYETALEMVRDVRDLNEAVARDDRDLARQLRRASSSVVLNIAEGSGSSGGTRKARYGNALGSARETLAGLEAACAIGYVDEIPVDVRRRFDHIIGTLVRVLYR